MYGLRIPVILSRKVTMPIEPHDQGCFLDPLPKLEWPSYILNSIMEKDISCPKCAAIMTFQGVESIGAGAARISMVESYLCPKCGCNGRYDENLLKVVEIK
jgi:hypothetical protein